MNRDVFYLSGVGSIVGTLVGGTLTFVAAKWALKRQLGSQHYIHVDNLYAELTALYIQYPRFGQLENTRDYKTAFSGEEVIKYHFFAQKVHTFLETIYDLHYQKDTQSIDYLWEKIFSYHASLHYRWLKDNQEGNHKECIEYVFQKCAIT